MHAEGDTGDDWVGPAPASDPDPPRPTGSKRRGVAPWLEPSDAEARHRSTRGLASELIGLTADAARKRIGDLHPKVTLRVVGLNDGVTADFRERRITVYIQDGLVVRAVAG